MNFIVSHAGEFIFMACLLACSGFFSASETALFSLSRGRLYRMGQSSHRWERMAASMMKSPRKVLNTLLLGNLIVNTGISAISAVMALELARSAAPAWTAAAASVGPLMAMILLGEIGPKMLALVWGPGLAVLAAGPLTVIGKVLHPAITVLDAALIRPLTRVLSPGRRTRTEITSDELAALLDLSARRGVIGRDTSSMLQEIMELTGLRVADIMVPRVDMAAYDVDGPPAGLLELFRTTRLKKIPVYERDIDGIIGLIYAKRLFLRPHEPLRGLVDGVLFVPEAANLERLLMQFRVKKKQLAIVVDEYGGTAGLVTLEDVIEEIVGDISEGAQPETAPFVRRLSKSVYDINGDLAVHEWADAFGIDLGRKRISTVGGFVISLLGRIPKQGETARYRNLLFTVESLRGRRIGRLRLELPGEGR